MATEDTPGTINSRLIPTLALLLTVACQNPEAKPGGVGIPEEFQDEQFSEQPSLDRSVEEHLTQLIRTSQIIEGHRVVELDLCNEADESLSFAYNIEWLDRAGKPVSDLEAVWTPLVLGAGEVTPIEFRAPSPRADSWRLIAASVQR